ncbi:MAG: serine hydrolase domain-containing protein [Pirellulaceae bacterium]|nr:serine hydrolase domain-containing protein [Pirellulaceae bacterium]
MTIGLLSSSGFAQENKAVAEVKALESLQKEIDRLRDEFQVPALWAGKFYSDGRSVIAASGVRKWNNDVSVKVDDAVHIGSCTKAMTAVMIAQLCSKGSLSFETTLSEIFPEVEGLADSDWGKVTVVDLLQHRSGAPANALWPILNFEHPGDPVAARRAMLDWLLKHNRPSEPKFLYSNVGFALLGHIVESIDHEPWESLIAQRLFEPLGIKSAGFGPVGNSSQAENQEQQPSELHKPWGHVASMGLANMARAIVGKPKVPNFTAVQIDNPPPLGPAGRVHLNLSDWSKFVLLFADEKGYEKVNVKPEIWSRLLKVDGAGNYAGGWILLEREWAGGRTLFHNGSNTTWYCVAFVAPGKNYCLLAATNMFGDSAAKVCDKAVVAAIAIGF